MRRTKSFRTATRSNQAYFDELPAEPVVPVCEDVFEPELPLEFMASNTEAVTNSLIAPPFMVGLTIDIAVDRRRRSHP